MALCRVSWAILSCPVLWGLVATAAGAADATFIRNAPVRAPAFDWSGFYTGGHVGFGRGSTRNSLSNPVSPDVDGAFSNLFGKGWGYQTEHILSNAVAVLIAAENTSLLGIRRVLIDADYRHTRLSTVSFIAR